jgi:hypothetical protein
MSEISAKTSGFVRDLGEAARQNPLSAALIGMGVVWLFTGGRTAEMAGEFVRRRRFDRTSDAAHDAVETARSTVKSGTDTIGEPVTAAKEAPRDGSAGRLNSAIGLGHDYADTATEYVSSMPGAAAEMFDMARSNLSDIFRVQPLALGAVGLAIGAGIAAALPSSEAEAAYFGETSDTVKEKAAEFATEGVERATGLAGKVMRAVTEEARIQGLTVDGAKSAGGTIREKAGRVMDAAGMASSERVTPSKSPPVDG